ncbi:hypothetical protein PROFUN_12592 [Planoprotostelium fungivorum]|uniref:Uncharacterized protein n=1 Tax=Planoprotostelium fungivorum TaxID=1890364 RepID=A0A2P6N681_9EUKA|nr:hypothetical protein PROFUN_12592 [Planoprotostelium fungivorum]
MSGPPTVTLLRFCSSPLVNEQSRLRLLIPFNNQKMRGALSLFAACIALSQAATLVREIKITSIPTTGYFSPIFTAESPTIFYGEANYSKQMTFQQQCHGVRYYNNWNPQPCSSYQIVLWAPASNSTLQFPDAPVLIRVTKADAVRVELGQNYTSPNQTLYTFSSDVPYATIFTNNANEPTVGFERTLDVGPNITVATRGYPHPLYTTSLPKTFTYMATTEYYNTPDFVYENVTYDTAPIICASQDVVLLDSDETGHTPPTLVVNTTGNYTARCQIYGNSSNHYALFKLTNPTIDALFINDSVIFTQPQDAFDIAYNCGDSDSINFSVRADGPFQSVIIDATQPTIPALALDLYEYNIPAGIYAEDYFGNYGSEHGCSVKSTLYRLDSSFFTYSFRLCYTVTMNSTFDVPAWSSAFVIQPPKGYCIRSDGIASNSTNSVTLSSESDSSFSYEDSNTSLFTITCSNDILKVLQENIVPMTVKFSLVPIDHQGVFGQIYNVSDLLIVQYPPLTIPSGIRSLNMTGSVVGLAFDDETSERRSTLSFNTMETNTSSSLLTFVVARGQGQMSINLGTAAGVNPSTSTTTSEATATSIRTLTETDSPVTETDTPTTLTDAPVTTSPIVTKPANGSSIETISRSDFRNYQPCWSKVASKDKQRGDTVQRMES